MDPRARGCRRVRRPRDQTGRQRLPHARPRRIRQPGRAQEPPRPFPRREKETSPRLSEPSRHPTLVCAPGHHHAGDGVHRHPRERTARALRSSGERTRTAGRTFGDSPNGSTGDPATRSTTSIPAKASAPPSRAKSPPNSSAPKSPAAAPSSRPTSTIPSSSR